MEKSMEIRLPKKYLKREESGYNSVYVIDPPENAPELSGYVLKIETDRVSEDKTSLTMHYGNEWDKKNRQYLYMFEREDKVKGVRSKRFRYTEEETYILYGRAISKTFDKRLAERQEKVTSGSGKLIRARYSDYQDHTIQSSIEWFISADADSKWVYEFTYNTLTDVGKHSCTAKGFSILEEYSIEDISVLFNVKDNLSYLLHQLDHVRSIRMKSQSKPFVYDKFGNLIKANSPGEVIALKAYDELLPSEIKYDLEKYGTFERPEAEKLRRQLYKIGKEMEKECESVIEEYRTQKIETIINDIKELTGVSMSLIKHFRCI